MMLFAALPALALLAAGPLPHEIAAAEPAAGPTCDLFLLAAPGALVGGDDLLPAFQQCANALRKDVHAVGKRVARDAISAAERAKHQAAIAALVSQMKVELEKVDTQAKLAARLANWTLQLAKLGDGPDLGCADPEALKGALKQAQAALGALETQLTKDPARSECCSGEVEEAAREVEQALEAVSKAVDCRAAGWLLEIPGSSAQLGSTGPVDVNVDAYVLDAYGAFRELRRWGKAAHLYKDNVPMRSGARMAQVFGTAPDAKTDARASVERVIAVKRLLSDLESEIETLAGQRGLRPRMIGILTPAATVSNATDDDSTGASVQVQFVSRHVDLGRGLRASLGGRLGIGPVFTASLPDDAPATPEATDFRTSYENAFVWSLGPRLAWPVGRASLTSGRYVELSAFGTAGQIQRLAEATVIESADKKSGTLAIPVGTDKTSWFFEAGARFLIFSDEKNDEQAYELGVLKPLLTFDYGWRWDRRLDDPALRTAFGSHPERRHFVRLTLSQLPVFGSGKVFYMSFAVESEWGRGNRLGPGTKMLLQGNVDLVKALAGSD